MLDEDINLLDESEDKNEGGEMIIDAGAQGRGDAHPPDPMTATTNAVQSNPSGLMFVCLCFEVAAAHHFVFQEMMSGPKNILRLDNKRVKQLRTVACKPGRGVAGVSVAKLA